MGFPQCRGHSGRRASIGTLDELWHGLFAARTAQGLGRGKLLIMVLRSANVTVC